MHYLTFGPHLVILKGKFKEVLKFAKEKIIKQIVIPLAKLLLSWNAQC
jgi:hypothetical protein